MAEPREVFRPGIIAGTPGIVLVHNHPAGNNEFSPQDRNWAERMARAGEIIGIDVHDVMVVIHDGSYVSMREESERSYRIGLHASPWEVAAAPWLKAFK